MTTPARLALAGLLALVLGAGPLLGGSRVSSRAAGVSIDALSFSRWAETDRG